MTLPLCVINTFGWDFLFIVLTLLALFLAPHILESFSYVLVFFSFSKARYKKYISESLIPKSNLNLKTIIFAIILIIILKFTVTSIYSMPFQSFSHIACNLDAVTVGPVAEELFFRGVVLSLLLLSFKKYFKRNNTAVIVSLAVSSLLFVLVHGNFLPEQILLKFLGSIIFGYVYIADKRNITAPILVHLAGNLSVFIMTMV